MQGHCDRWDKGKIMLSKSVGFVKAVVLSIAVGGMLLGVSLTASAAKMTKMQEARHASPMPNLMMLVMQNATKLNLEEEQKKALKSWKQGNNSTVRRLTTEIIEFENELRQATLDGVSINEKNDLRDFIIESRGKLIDIRYLCAINMQKILTKGQWEQAMALHDRQRRLAASANAAGNEIQAFLRVSPMPKLMAIVLMHSSELALNAEQSKALQDWRLQNMNHWALLFDQVLRAEKIMTENALTMVDAKKLMENYSEMSAKRNEMATMSLACRDNMRKVLNDSQWEMMIGLLRGYMTSR